MLDGYSRWAWAKAVKEFDAFEVAEFLAEVISFAGPPQVLQSDQGYYFMDGVVEELHQLPGMARLRSAPYRPKLDGKVKNPYRQVISHLANTIINRGTRWDYFLANALASHRTRVHKALGKSPYEVLFGLPPRLRTRLE